MIHLTVTFILSIALSAVSAPLPLQKRIAQVIADSTRDWEQACVRAGGGQKCNPISQIAFTSLLAAGKNCDQQDAADQMVNLAKSLNAASPDAEMIRLAQLFVQQPRNAPDSLQVPYCQKAPANKELNGLFHCQFAGTVAKGTSFSGDQTGNLPLGVKSVNPPGSCPAKKDGPVPDGQQLNTLVKSPGQGAASSGNSATPPPPSGNSAQVEVKGQTPPPASTTKPSPASDAKPFTAQNGKDAQALNAKFATLNAKSSCEAGEQACLNGGFAQCVGSSFVVTQCAGGAQCFALPLVNKAGTSITCTTQADAEARIAATGNAGGVTGGSKSTANQASQAPTKNNAQVSSPAPPAAAGAKPFTAQNGKDAQSLNAKFASLTADSACSAGDQACINGGFAQCVGGKFATSGCAAGTQCFALPLVNKAGTSLACTTKDDALARIQNTGVSGGITGA